MSSSKVGHLDVYLMDLVDHGLELRCLAMCRG